jgi:RecJ-like exonuclease
MSMIKKVLCLSHGKDVDGIASATITKIATGAEIVFIDYGNLIEHLESIKSSDEIYICDLGISGVIANSFLKEIKRIRKFATVQYIDHHPIDMKIKDKLIEVGVQLHHSLDECASILTFTKFKNDLKMNVDILAAYGAVTDYMDEQPIAKSIIAKYDRQFILLESTLLTHALLGSKSDNLFKEKIVQGLLELNYPHEIKGILENARKGLEETSRLMKLVTKEGVKGNWIAHMQTKEGSTGTVASLLIGAFDVPVGIAYRFVDEENVCEISLRAIYDFKYDLGKLVTRVTNMIGGSGGGHSKASGARIPKELLKDFIDLIEFEIDKSVLPTRR